MALVVGGRSALDVAVIGEQLGSRRVVRLVPGHPRIIAEALEHGQSGREARHRDRPRSLGSRRRPARARSVRARRTAGRSDASRSTRRPDASACSAAMAACSLVRPGRMQLERSVEDRDAVGDRLAVPERAVLFVERDRLDRSGDVRPGRRASVRTSRASRPCASATSGHSPTSSRASRIASPHRSARTRSVATRCRVALGEDQVDHPQHAGQSFGQIVRFRNLVADLGDQQLALRPSDPLEHRRLAHQEGASDLGHLETTERAQASAPAATRSRATGWQHVKIIRSRSSGTSPTDRSSHVARRPTVLCRRPPSPPSFPTPRDTSTGSGRDERGRSPAGGLSRSASRPGRSGIPSVGQCRAACANASCTASSASAMSPPT